MKEKQKKIAQLLLQINAIKLNPATPFIWASGWKSPIYCDNRKTLSYPKVRQVIKENFCDIIKSKYPEADGIAGVATGAIAIGILVAEELGLPFIYIRSSAKGHGMENQIEGDYQKGNKYVVIEDLISTGGSSLNAVNALRSTKCEVLGMIAIFSYGFPLAVDNFLKSDCKVDTLSNYEILIEEAVESNYIKKSDIELLQEWRKAPDKWKQN